MTLVMAMLVYFCMGVGFMYAFPVALWSINNSDDDEDDDNGGGGGGSDDDDDPPPNPGPSGMTIDESCRSSAPSVCLFLLITTRCNEHPPRILHKLRG